MRKGFALGVLALLVLVPPRSWATTGGPTWVVPLGYGPTTERVYWGLDSQSEAEPGSDPRIFYFDLRSAEPGKAHIVDWSHPEIPDAKFWARRDAFVRALRPLEEEYGPQLQRRTVVVGVADSVSWDEARYARYRARVMPPGDFPEGVEVLTLDTTAVAVARMLRIPGRPERLIVIAFVGDPFESTYETQWPILERKGLRPPVVEWNPPTR